MSAVATFTKLPIEVLPAIREHAVPKKKFLGKGKDEFPGFLAEHGQEVVAYTDSGYAIVTLLVYLQEKMNVDLMKSAHEELDNFLTEARRATHATLTHDHKLAYGDALSAPFSEESLRDYFNEFNEANEPEMGKAMLDGIRALREALDQVDEKSVILL